MSKKIWVDVLTPKQALFTKAMIERAPGKVRIVVTTRDYDELNKFLEQIKLEHRSFGRHGGASLEGKLKAGIERMEELAPFVFDFDSSLSFISPEAARVSFGLGIEHFICSDSPHASAPARLAVPLASKLFSPFPIKKERWAQYGLKNDQVNSYHALDPWAWILSRKASKKKRKESIVIRLEESSASYMKQGSGISSVVGKLISSIKSTGDFEIMIVPRYEDQREWAKKKFGKICSVPGNTIDARELISSSSLMIGGGGTMTQEAALLGVPNVSYFPSAELDVFENFYFPQKLSVKAVTPSDLIKKTTSLLKNIDHENKEQEDRARKLTSSFQDPVKFIFENIL